MENLTFDTFISCQRFAEQGRGQLGLLTAFYAFHLVPFPVMTDRKIAVL